MSSEFHRTVRRLEDSLAGGMWDRATAELQNAYALQPQNPYLNAFAERLAMLQASSSGGTVRAGASVVDRTR